MRRCVKLTLEGSELAVQYENIALGTDSGIVRSYPRIYEYVEAHRRRGRRPPILHPCGKVTGLDGCTRWWAKIPANVSLGYGSADARMLLRPDKVRNILTRLLRWESKASEKLEADWKTVGPQVPTQRSDHPDGGLALTPEGLYGASTELKNIFLATPLSSICMRDAVAYETRSAAVRSRQQAKAVRSSEIFSAAQLYVRHGAPPPTAHNNVMLLTTAGGTSALIYSARMHFDYYSNRTTAKTKLSWNPAGETVQDLRTQINSLIVVSDPQLELEWLVCAMPYGYETKPL